MPNIREYTNPIEGLQIDNRGAQAAVNAGRAQAQSYQTIGSAIGDGIETLGGMWVKAKINEEMSNGLKTQAEIMDGINTAWQNAAKDADPNDPSTAAKFREEQLEPILQAWASTFTTEESKKWAEASVGQMRQHFFEKTAADQASLAGMGAVQNLTDTKTFASNMVMKDPTSLDIVKGMYDTAIEAAIQRNPNLTVAQQNQIRSELRDTARKEFTTAAFLGMARANPQAAQQALVAGFGATELDGTDRNHLYGIAESYRNAEEADVRAAHAAERQAQKDDFEAKTAAVSAQMWDPQTGGIRVPRNFGQTLVELSLHPSADAGAINALRNAGAAATQDAITGTYRHTDNATWTNLASKIGQPAGSPQALTVVEVDQAYAAGKLAVTDYRFLRQAAPAAGSGQAINNAAMARLNKALDQIKPLIAKSTMYSIDQTGTANYQAFHFDTYQAFNRLVEAGSTPSQAVDILTDPRDPRGLQQRMAPYQVNNKSAMAAMRGRFSQEGGPTGPTSVPTPGGVAPRLPNETPAQYLKRTGQ